MAYLMKYNDDERLNRLNRNIWRSGFNVSTLTELRLLTKEIQNGICEISLGNEEEKALNMAMEIIE